jgi:beta-glucanase (GH16 family)
MSFSYGYRGGGRVSAIGTATSPTQPSSLPVPLGVSGNFALAFRDEFNGSSIDTSKWLVGGSAEDPGTILDGFSTGDWLPANATVSSSVLSLVTNTGGGQNHGAAITSHGKFSIGYGCQEFRIQVVGPEAWAAAWMQSHENGTGGQGIECDFIEQRSFASDFSTLQSAIHSNGYATNEEHYPFMTLNAWHVVTVNWQPTFIRVYVDAVLGVEYTTDIPNPASVVSPGQFMIFDSASHQAAGTDAGGALLVDYYRYWTGN